VQLGNRARKYPCHSKGYIGLLKRCFGPFTIKRSPQNDRRTSILRNNRASFINGPTFKSLWYDSITI